MSSPNEIRFYRAVGQYGFLSNLHRSTLIFEGREFSCSEAAYQYGKAKDPAVAEWIVSAPKPHLMAIAAHGLFSFDITDNWSILKVCRMRRVLLEKFSQNPDLLEKLIATGDATLIEESKTDAFWGIGKKGNGKNTLGVLLMEVRTWLTEKVSDGGQQ